MIAVDKIIDRLILDEGLEKFPYFDTAMPPRLTIGVGRNLTDVGISEEESRYLLANDIRKWVAIAGQWDWYADLSWQRQGVIICMLHQLGAKGVANFRKMLDALARGDYESAADEMIDSAWHKQTSTRCELMAQIMRSGVWQ